MLLCSHVFLLLAALAVATPPASADNLSSVNLIANGSFDTPATAANPLSAGWQPLNPWGSVTVGLEVGRKYGNYEIRGSNSARGDKPINWLAIQNLDGSRAVGAQTITPIDPGVRYLLLTGSVMIDGLTPGPLPSQRAWCAVSFRMADQSTTAPIAESPSWDAPTPLWRKYCAEIKVPVGTIAVQVTPEIDHCVGEAHFEDFGLQQIPAPARWVLTFADEFNGPALDQSKWTASVGNADWQKSYYKSSFSPANITFENGYLRIRAEKQAGSGMPYVSGEILSLGKFAQTYGCIEARIRMPRDMGTWPAVYMIPYDDTWPPEIDIAEATGRWPTTRMVNNHWKDQDGRHLQWAGTFEDPAYDRTQWHTHRVVWDRGCMRFYDDGKLIGATSPDNGIADMPMYLRINLVVGGWGSSAPLPGNPPPRDLALTSWPQYFDVDYIRVYQRADRPLPVTVGPSQEITLPVKTVTLTAQTCNPIGDGTVEWTFVGGPAAPTIGSPRGLSTTVTCPSPGMYRFRFTIRKDGDSGAADALVYVNPRAPA